MRATLTLDQDVVALIERQIRKRGDSFNQIVNEALRRSLTANDKFVTTDPLASYDLGTRAGFDATRALMLAAELDDEALLAKLALGR